MYDPMMLNPVMRLGFELPTLKLDLRLRTEQLAAWEKLEQALRSMAPPGRAERAWPWPRPSESPPTATETLNGEAAILKSLSGKIDAVAAAMAELYANLDTEQRGLLDRRLAPPRPR